ncbi:39S ribosomal protein L10, mitochondrial [Coccinella septempunctata]|uniref:39S ribosomal protein L10, mitochondrial n=1 Tax=Coccinella septempunctata TaxID=41139 RepID=UPI001D07B9DA|nr:39S ribosomal protein L10, mitochondrial [Coccinella septempunctata]
MSLLRKPLLDTVTYFVQPKRFRGKINIQRPKPPHFTKAKYLEICKPIFESSKKNKTMVELCGINKNRKEEEVDNPFQRIIAKEALGYFQSSRLIAFYHFNHMTGIEQFKALSMFHKEGMHMKWLGKKTLEMALKGTPYETVLDFYMSRNMTVFSTEPKVKQLLRINKRFPQLVLLAGIYEEKFLNLDELIKLSKVPSLEMAQSMFVHTLNASANRLHRQLNSHQTSLLALLEDRKKQLDDN